MFKSSNFQSKQKINSFVNSVIGNRDIIKMYINLPYCNCNEMVKHWVKIRRERNVTRKNLNTPFAIRTHGRLFFDRYAQTPPCRSLPFAVAPAHATMRMCVKRPIQYY